APGVGVGADPAPASRGREAAPAGRPAGELPDRRVLLPDPDRGVPGVVFRPDRAERVPVAPVLPWIRLLVARPSRLVHRPPEADGGLPPQPPRDGGGGEDREVHPGAPLRVEAVVMA